MSALKLSFESVFLRVLYWDSSDSLFIDDGIKSLPLLYRYQFNISKRDASAPSASVPANQTEMSASEQRRHIFPVYYLTFTATKLIFKWDTYLNMILQKVISTLASVADPAREDWGRGGGGARIIFIVKSQWHGVSSCN